ncbi:hypothetical protein LPJ64_003237 [Coemansia asiatica]|uniref:Uncharacterized protein n=1 Tax=Coemansia asiatica TaxID=1052880 RepID=A0A9W7XM23_9FUNG|nr:hypothetical protein LPJ64_003237 [Coemansia asiatica]
MYFANTIALFALCASTVYSAASSPAATSVHMQEIPHGMRLSRLNDNSNMPVLIDVASLVAAATQMHMDNAHQRDEEVSVLAARPTANIEDVFNNSNGVMPKNHQPSVNNNNNSNGMQQKNIQSQMQQQQQQQQQPKGNQNQPVAIPVSVGSVAKQGIQGKITVPAKEIHSHGPVSAAVAATIISADKQGSSANHAAVTAVMEDVDVETMREKAIPHTTRTVIAHQFKTTTVADADDSAEVDGDRQSHKKKKDDKIIASIKSGSMDRFAGDESGAVSSSRYCSAALAAFVIVAASYF